MTKFDELATGHLVLDRYNISSKQVRIEANRSNGKVTFVLPCGQQRSMDRENFQKFAQRIAQTEAWLTAPEAVKEF